ncbi:N-carbamoyl-L-amino acid hydrolase [Arthrobacter saudimassiliensis]|uniref:N-carbamoyl-L-amino acid hydrolase n=1 Tax=Arthrobacter saudimassiliensis TaxID=1461584 RepID=A0A078MTQ7_9MICC|nr:N-carbamoyl-L-amino acid hydrolase [Arthrobacter saudimassiliensis]
MQETALTGLDAWLDTALAELSGFRSEDRPGWTREVFSEPYRASRAWTAARMRGAGLQVHQDAAGNLVGRLPGTNPAAPPLVTGSHTDTVDGGGRYDGVVGVLGALAAVQVLAERGIRLQRDLLVVDFLGEESNPFGLSCLGSRALAGELTAADLARTDYRGRTLAAAYEDFGLDPAALLAAAPWTGTRRPHAYVELHIEQGPVLEERGTPIGIVTAITGIERLVASFTGSPDHAGTRPMDDRRDAMVAAAEAVLAVRAEGCGAPEHGVATVTRLENASPAPNVVPSLVRLYGEVRSVDETWLAGTRARLAGEIAARAAGFVVEADLRWSTDNQVVRAAAGVQDLAAQAADVAGIEWAPIPSGATHDAVHMARLAPMGMIFVPSAGGRSHCPEEFTPTARITTGVNVLAETLLRLDTHEFAQ